MVVREPGTEDNSSGEGEVRVARVAPGRGEPKRVDRLPVPDENVMGKLNRKELELLERRELQLTILAAAFVLVQAAGLAMFMYPLVFLHPIGNKWTLRVAFFGFCALTLLFIGYLLAR